MFFMKANIHFLILQNQSVSHQVSVTGRPPLLLHIWGERIFMTSFHTWHRIYLSRKFSWRTNSWNMVFIFTQNDFQLNVIFHSQAFIHVRFKLSVIDEKIENRTGVHCTLHRRLKNKRESSSTDEIVVSTCAKRESSFANKKASHAFTKLFNWSMVVIKY